GHRVTHTHPFEHIDLLDPGDEVIFVTAGRRVTYAVTRAEVVRPKVTYIVNQTANATATLFACHPPRSATYRYVVHLVPEAPVARRPGRPARRRSARAARAAGHPRRARRVCGRGVEARARVRVVALRRARRRAGTRAQPLRPLRPRLSRRSNARGRIGRSAW